MIKTRAEEYFSRDPSGLLPADSLNNCYKLLRYYMSTQRLHLLNLRAGHLPLNLASTPNL